MASAMPTHIMSCFRLPKGVTKKIMSTIAHFGGVVVEIRKVYTGNHGTKSALI